MGLSLVATAFAVTAAHGAETNDVGPTVREALEMQRSGEHSAPMRPMLEDVADRSYERYLESFTHPIPERFERDDSFSPDSGG